MFVLSSRSKFISALVTNVTIYFSAFRHLQERERKSYSVIELHRGYAALRETTPSRSTKRKVSDISMRHLHRKYLLYNVCALAVYRQS